MRYAEKGQYPSRFSLSDVESWDPSGSPSVPRARSSVEGDQAGERGVSFTAVSAEGGHRIRVVDGSIEDQGVGVTAP